MEKFATGLWLSEERPRRPLVFWPTKSGRELILNILVVTVTNQHGALGGGHTGTMQCVIDTPGAGEPRDRFNRVKRVVGTPANVIGQ